MALVRRAARFYQNPNNFLLKVLEIFHLCQPAWTKDERERVNLNPVHQFDRFTHCNQRYPALSYFWRKFNSLQFFFVLRDAYLFENIYLRDEGGGELKGKRSVVLWCFGVTAKADQSTVKKGN